jgi:hypothetical protein
MAIAKDLVKEKGIPTEPIATPFNIFNADGSKNRQATISEYMPMQLSMDGHTEQLEAVVADIKGTEIYIGHNWLVKHNPKINWKEGVI